MKHTNSRNIEMSGGASSNKVSSCGYNIDCDDLKKEIRESTKTKLNVSLNMTRADDLKDNVNELKKSYEEYNKKQAEIKES